MIGLIILKLFRYKFVVADAVANYLTPIREKLNNYLAKPEYLCDVLEVGRIAATKRAQTTLEEVYSKTGTVLKMPGLKTKRIKSSQ